MTKTTWYASSRTPRALWFAQNSLPLRWQRQLQRDNQQQERVVICSKFITFAVTKTTIPLDIIKKKLLWFAQNSLPLRWQRQPKMTELYKKQMLWFAQNSLPLRWQRQHCTMKLSSTGVVICSKFITFAVTKTTTEARLIFIIRCDLLKIHYLCGDKDNRCLKLWVILWVVICSKFITFAVTKTTLKG